MAFGAIGWPGHRLATPDPRAQSAYHACEMKPPNSYVILMRGINVGGKNKIPMADLRMRLEEQGFENVKTLIQSGNVVLRSHLAAKTLGVKIERVLSQSFTLDSSIIRVLALRETTFETVVSEAPTQFGKDASRFRYYVLFPMGPSPRDIMEGIETRPEVDTAWQGTVAIYYRLPSLTSPNATKSYLNRLTQKRIYQSVTMRNWSTTTKLLKLLKDNAPG